jgi:hypothetical protein
MIKIEPRLGAELVIGPGYRHDGRRSIAPVNSNDRPMMGLIDTASRH